VGQNSIDVDNLVDFGAGAGKNGKLARSVLGSTCKLIAVEGYEPAAIVLREQNIYDRVDHALLQDWVDSEKERHSVALFGDVIEHLTPSEIHRVLKACIKKFDYVIVVVPLYDIFQDDSYGNELEVHKAYITPSFFDRYKPAERHIVEGETYTIMNLLIETRRPKKPLLKSVLWNGFHLTMLALQPLGLARPLVSAIKATIGARAGKLRTH
jgi:hypothetical protein